jgi:hypothetical protein
MDGRMEERRMVHKLLTLDTQNDAVQYYDLMMAECIKY